MRARCFLLAVGLTFPIPAQWVNVPTSKIPRTKNGKPDLTAPAPLTPEGKPDLSGTWALDVEGFNEDLAAYLGSGDLPIQLWAQAVTDERQTNGAGGVPTARCLSPGIPMLAISSIAHPFKLIQERDLVVILYEYFGEFRQIFLDERAPIRDPNPTWLGYSIGRWDGSVLVVDTTGFNGKIWLDTGGHPATDALHITERFQRVDYGHLEVQLTIDDRQAYKRPWTVTLKMHLLPDGELFEYVCNENERDSGHVR